MSSRDDYIDGRAIDGEGNRMDVGHVLERNVSTDDGDLKIFSFPIHLGDKQLAEFLQGGVNLAISEISLRGAATARRFGENIGKMLSKKHGDKLGAVAYNGWLFGLSAADVLGGLKTTVKNGYEEIYKLREDAQPLLAANDQQGSTVGGALTANYGVLAHARSKVMHDMKRDILSDLVSALRIVPNIIMGVQKKRLDEVDVRLGTNSSLHVGDTMESHPPGYVPDFKDAHEAANTLVKKDFWKRMFDPRKDVPDDYEANIKSLRAAPGYVGFLADVLGRKINYTPLPEDAWDKIVTLGHFVKGESQPDQDAVEEKVKKIFEQRAKDLGHQYSLEGPSFKGVVKVIAEAIVQDKLHPQALAEILDNTKIVTFGRNDADFGDKEEVKHQVDKLVMKYSRVYVEKEVYQNAPFTKQTLAETYKNISEGEKPFFTMLFPSGVLENAGVKHAEVKKYREAGKQEFVDQLTEIVKFLQAKGRDELVKEGVKGKYIDSLEDMKPEFDRAARDNDASDYVREHLRDVTKTVRNIATSAKQPGEMWKEFLARGDSGRTEEQPKTPVDHAQTKKPGDEIQVGT